MNREQLDNAHPEFVRQEGVYMVNRSDLLHVKEVPDGDFAFAAFDKQSKQKTAEGKISRDTVLEGMDPTHDYLAAARDVAIQETGLVSIEVAQVGLTSLRRFRESDIYRRVVWEPETLPKDDICFINSSYEEQFRIANGGTIDIEYPDRIFSTQCQHIDDYHARIGTEVYHMCQFAEIMERNGAVIRPEAVLETEQAAWKIGRDKYLAVECGAGQWDYHLFDGKMDELKGGSIEVIGCSINEVRDMVLAENGLERCSMTQTHYGILMENAAVRAEKSAVQEQPERKPSIKAQLAAKPIPGGQPTTKPKEREVR